MRQKQVYKSPIAAMLWSIALPGLGQLYNRDYIPAFLLLTLEFLINLFSNLNLAILYSFNGDFQQAHEIINYEWGLFYPAVYGYSVWQAYNYAKSINYRSNGNGPLKRTFFTGWFFGLVIGMDLGLFWHNLSLFEELRVLSFLHFPVQNGLVFGLLGALLGHLIEKIYKRKTVH
ncbi:hypothetical protein [Mesobacillus maritimus]|uniref:DUF5683 domain-containing protein n=1 Tax=Mesobacillus maritimus TaxID=1643336 RepID=A0ABS7KAJ5_9BACI|nr:hypothetical protein [Mesobacillus maritimus]MBY0099135.1 hypothetical protein [Mesobacillus maritimus]